MNNAIASFYDAIAAADLAVQKHVRACRVWNQSDRSQAFPQMVEGEDTAVLGRVSCVLSPAPQSSRTNASRKNWKVDGKRVSQAVAMEALHAMVAEAPAAQEAVVIEGETISAASAIVQAADIARGIPTVVSATQDGYTTCSFSKRTMQELVHLCDGLISYVDEGGQVEMGSSPHMAGMREGGEVEDLIYLVGRTYTHMARTGLKRATMALNRKMAVVLLSRMRLALDLAWDKSQDERDVEARRTYLALRDDMAYLKDSFAKSVDGAK
ncbi:hypothetical protein RCIP0075_00058 [Klebsiella phage RCIP0075]